MSLLINKFGRMTNLYLWQWHGLVVFSLMPCIMNGHDAGFRQMALQSRGRYCSNHATEIIALILQHITAFTSYINSLVGYSMYVNVFRDVVPCLETTAVTRFVIFSMLTKESQNLRAQPCLVLSS